MNEWWSSHSEIEAERLLKWRSRKIGSLTEEKRHFAEICRWRNLVTD